MRRSIVRFTTPIGKSTGLFTVPFSTGRGRGRGAGVDPFYNFVKTAPGEPIDDGNNVSRPGNGRGGGEIGVPAARVGDFGSDNLTRSDPREFGRKVPEFIQRMEEENAGEGFDDIVVNTRKGGDEENVRFGLVNVLTGTGRGTVQGGGGGRGIGVKQQENRFIRARQENVGSGENANVGSGENANVNVRANVKARENVSVRTPGKKFDNPEDATKNAMEILSRADGSGDGSVGYGGGDRGERVMESGGRGGGRGRGRGGRGFRGRGGRGGGRFGGRERYEQDNEDDDDDEDGCFLGDPADGEKLARKLGPETMNQLVEGFEEISEYVLPSVQQDAFIEAMHINYAVLM